MPDTKGSIDGTCWSCLSWIIHNPITHSRSNYPHFGDKVSIGAQEKKRKNSEMTKWNWRFNTLKPGWIFRFQRWCPQCAKPYCHTSRCTLQYHVRLDVQGLHLSRCNRNFLITITLNWTALSCQRYEYRLLNQNPLNTSFPFLSVQHLPWVKVCNTWHQHNTSRSAICHLSCGRWCH